MNDKLERTREMKSPKVDQKQLSQQINDLDQQIKKLEKMESELAAGREKMTPEMKKLKNQIANRRVVMGMDQAKRSKIKKLMKKQVKKGKERDDRDKEVAQLQKELEDMREAWPKLYGDRPLPDPCQPCLEAAIAEVSRDWQPSYPPQSKAARKTAEDVIDALKELGENTDDKKMKGIFREAQEHRVSWNIRTAVFNRGLLGSAAWRPVRGGHENSSTKNFAGKKVKFIEYDPKTFDKTKYPNIMATPAEG